MVWVQAALAQTADSIRIATFAAPLSRDGPGLLLQGLIGGDDPKIEAIVTIVDQVSPDILVLTDFDYDEGGAAMAAFSDRLIMPFPHQFARRPNAGVQVGLDVDGDGYTGDARDALGYGRFLGDGGIAVFSRYPIGAERVTDLTDMLWRDIPNATLPFVDGAPFPSEKVHAVLPVSSSAHWIIPITVGPEDISLLAYSATAPVFDGPEDFNGLRNRDELRIWEAVLDGVLTTTPTTPVLIGNTNVEPFDGQGIKDGIDAILARPELQDPQPRGAGGQAAADTDHVGDPGLDTADWPSDGPGNLRVSYVLPSRDLNVTGAGVFWPAPDDPLAALLGGDGLAAGPHRLVWVDVQIEGLR